MSGQNLIAKLLDQSEELEIADMAIPSLTINIDHTEPSDRGRQIDWLMAFIKSHTRMQLASEKLHVRITLNHTESEADTDTDTEEGSELATTVKLMRPYEYAAMVGDLGCFTALLTKMNLLPTDHYFFIIALIENRSHDCIRHLFSHFKSKPDVLNRLCKPTSDKAWSPYLYAAYSGYTGLIELFRPYSNTTRFVTSKTNYNASAPMLAAEQGHTEALDFFIDNPDCKDELNMLLDDAPSVLSITIREKLLRSAFKMLERGALTEVQFTHHFPELEHEYPIIEALEKSNGAFLRALVTFSPATVDAFHQEIIFQEINARYEELTLNHEDLLAIKLQDDISMGKITISLLIKCYQLIQSKLELGKETPDFQSELRQVIDLFLPATLPPPEATLDEPTPAEPSVKLSHMLTLKKALRTLQGQIAELTATVNSKALETEVQVRSLEELQKQFIKLENQIKKRQDTSKFDAAKRKITALSNERDTLQSQIEKLTEQLKNQKSQNAGLKAALEKQKANFERLKKSTNQTKINELTAEIKSLASTLKDKSEIISSLREEIETKAETHRSAHRKEITAMQTDFQTEKQELISEYQAETAVLTTSFEKQQQALIDKHTFDLSTLETKQKALTEQLQQRTTTTLKHQSELATKNSTIISQTQYIRHLEFQLAQAHQQNHQLYCMLQTRPTLTASAPMPTPPTLPATIETELSYMKPAPGPACTPPSTASTSVSSTSSPEAFPQATALPFADGSQTMTPGLEEIRAIWAKP